MLIDGSICFIDFWLENVIICIIDIYEEIGIYKVMVFVLNKGMVDSVSIKKIFFFFFFGRLILEIKLI